MFEDYLLMQLPVFLFWDNVLTSGLTELLSLVGMFYLLSCVTVALHLSLLDKVKTQYCGKLTQSYPAPSDSTENGKSISKSVETPV